MTSSGFRIPVATRQAMEPAVEFLRKLSIAKISRSQGHSIKILKKQIYYKRKNITSTDIETIYKLHAKRNIVKN